MHTQVCTQQRGVVLSGTASAVAACTMTTEILMCQNLQMMHQANDVVHIPQPVYASPEGLLWLVVIVIVTGVHVARQIVR
jgi:hypothetical protein